jgi:hypothetical protein
MPFHSTEHIVSTEKMEELRKPQKTSDKVAVTRDEN